ncbi:hypothetical protein HPP92_023614 [Vanilla planifolia]|uniref:Uncharacterized protein n=1 Tax=Vanilla planifolia TaxID=51239 RepID=A0A835UCT3_VANPL|nr:hypothetical protein HPP92_023923 [Vanilla planifolia]KAG0455826.1 hypothetical protein HPP92_023614 [Vanilla planifolia]
MAINAQVLMEMEIPEAILTHFRVSIFYLWLKACLPEIRTSSLCQNGRRAWGPKVPQHHGGILDRRAVSPSVDSSRRSTVVDLKNRIEALGGHLEPKMHNTCWRLGHLARLRRGAV